MSADERPKEEPTATPDRDQPTSPDATLRLTDDGLELPEVLKGYVGEFQIRTPKVTGTFETTDAGLPDGDFYDGVIAVFPDAGAYHGDLDAGMMAISTDEHRETVYEIIDERTEADR
jgi:hypothetical protein